MDELKVVVKQNLGSIEFNHEEIKRNVEIETSDLIGAVFTDDTIDIAKKIVAEWNKKLKILSDERIRVKKEYMLPCTEFENKVKEISKVVEEPLLQISKQISEYEEIKKQEKKQKLITCYNGLSCDVLEYLTFDKIFDEKWLNKTYSINKIEEEIQDAIDTVSMDIKTIKAMNTEVESEALEKYKANLKLSDAVSYITNYDQQKAAILKRDEEKRKADEEAAHQREIDRVKREERELIEKEEQIREEERLATEQRLLSIKKPVEIIEPLETVFEDETDDMEKPFDTCIVESKPVTVFKVLGSVEEIAQIEMYMNSIGIDYEKGVL